MEYLPLWKEKCINALYFVFGLSYAVLTNSILPHKIVIGHNIYITISTYTAVCPYGVGVRRRPVTSHFQFLSCTEFLKPSQTAAERGEAELRTLDFKTTWSEFQKTSQTTAERGVAELRILDFKTTWSEFQKPR